MPRFRNGGTGWRKEVNRFFLYSFLMITFIWIRESWKRLIIWFSWCFNVCRSMKGNVFSEFPFLRVKSTITFSLIYSSLIHKKKFDHRSQTRLKGVFALHVVYLELYSLFILFAYAKTPWNRVRFNLCFYLSFPGTSKHLFQPNISAPLRASFSVTLVV